MPRMRQAGRPTFPVTGNYRQNSQSEHFRILFFLQILHPEADNLWLFDNQVLLYELE